MIMDQSDWSMNGGMILNGWNGGMEWNEWKEWKEENGRTRRTVLIAVF